ncbi:MAG: hypothetical protein PHW60_09495 [Kiritimatiellae bacterium]|nr:hypothetical protein [Kiritimatiellia bacterium]
MSAIRIGVRSNKRTNVFAYVALWQALVFVLLICLIWACEQSDILSFYFDASMASSGILRAYVMSIGVLVCAFVMIGNTYLQQKRIVSGFMIICAYCKQIKIDNNIWEQIEGYISKHSQATFSHGICPKCFAKITQETHKSGTGLARIRVNPECPI